MIQQEYFEQFPGEPWEEQSSQQSKFMKEHWQDPEYRQEMEQLNVGRKHSEETKRKIGDGNRGENNGNYGKVCTPEEVKFRRQIGSSWKRTPEYLAKLRQPKSREHARKIGMGIRKHYQTHEYSLEGRLRLSKEAKRNWANGVYDGRFMSPTNPERTTMQVLDDLEIDYQFNSFRLETKLYDFFLPEQNILIEYDGYYWHSRPDAAENDELKDRLACDAGIPLIRLKGLSDHDLAYDEIYEQLRIELWPYQGNP